ncbi:MAG: glycosyltransferase [Candidatus Aenigmarchaeota archaeon]|nr:glycosyltransferase [Candidatus Aenigmarchaeota archaeon]
MKFSFIIPAKNEEGYIGECLESIKAQKNKNYEIIVVDSYSNDNTAKIASRYGAKVVFEKRKGPAVARNTGAEKATGDVLVFADADVRFSRDFIDEIEIRFFNRPIKLGGAIFRLETYDAKSSSVKAAYKFANVLVNLSNRLGIVMTLGSCFVFEKGVFNAVGGFNHELLTNEDHDIARRVAKEKHVRYFSDITVYTSSRRVAKRGIFRMVMTYAKSTLVYFLKHKSLKDYWD